MNRMAIEKVLLDLAVKTGAPMLRPEFDDLMRENGLKSNYEAYVEQARERIRTRALGNGPTVATRSGDDFIRLGEYGFARASAITKVSSRRSPSGETYYEVRIDGDTFCYPSDSEAVANILKWMNVEK